MDPFARSRTSTQYRRIFLLSDNTLPLADFRPAAWHLPKSAMSHRRWSRTRMRRPCDEVGLLTGYKRKMTFVWLKNKWKTSP